MWLLSQPAHEFPRDPPKEFPARPCSTNRTRDRITGWRTKGTLNLEGRSEPFFALLDLLVAPTLRQRVFQTHRPTGDTAAPVVTRVQLLHYDCTVTADIVAIVAIDDGYDRERASYRLQTCPANCDPAALMLTQYRFCIGAWWSMDTRARARVCETWARVSHTQGRAKGSRSLWIV